jgi:hypothetical protein
MKLFIRVLASFVMALAFGRCASAEVVSLWMEVQGTRCPPCARGLEDAVKRLEGVSSARFGGLAPQKLAIGVKNGEWVDLEKVWALIARQGYRIRKENTHLILRGRIAFARDTWTFTMEGKPDPTTIAIEPSCFKGRDSASPPNAAGSIYNLREMTAAEIEGTILVSKKRLKLLPRRISDDSNRPVDANLHTIPPLPARP